MNGDDTAIVTGASGGIGAAIAKAMLERGHRVISLALDKPEWAHPRLESHAIDLLDAKATAADNLTFRRILALSPNDFVAELGKHGII